MAVQLISPNGTKNLNLTQDYVQQIFGYDASKKLTALQAYTRNSFFRACIDLRASTLSQVPFTIVRADRPDAVIYDTDRDYDFPDELSWMSNMHDLIFNTEASLVLVGSAYMGKILDRGKLLGIQWFSPGTVEEIYDRSTGQITGFKRKIGGKYNTYDAEDVVSIYQTDPLTEIGPGNPIGTAARINADVLHSLNTYLDNVLDNGLLKATLVGVPFGTPKEERDRVERKWFDWFGGSKNGGKIKVVEADAVSVQTIGDGVESLGNLKLSLEQREMIASVMGIPMSIIMSNAANFATAKQDDVSFYTKTIIPQANRIAMKLNRSIFAQTGYRISFEPQRLETLQRHEVEKATSLSQLTGGAPILTVNEARAMLGFDPIDGSAEQAVIGSNLTTPEEAQIQDQARSDAQSESPLSAEQEGEIKAWRKKIKNAKDPLVQFNREHLPLKIYLAIRDRLESGLEVSEAFSPPWDF